MNAEQKVNNRQIGIVGMARSGLAAALLAKRHDGKPFVSDSASESKLIEASASLRKNNIPFETGGHTEMLLKSDFLVISPGVPENISILKEAKDKGIPMFSELEFASWFCRADIFAITGSNGKTTTTTLVGEMLNAGGVNAVVCGNIGNPFSDVTDKLGSKDVAVVEVSSFQLEHIEEFSPKVAMILNISPDHLDRHGDFETYRLAKYRITENQQPEGTLVLNKDDAGIKSDTIKSKAIKRFFTTTDDRQATAYVESGQIMLNDSGGPFRIMSSSEILIPGPHNLQNSLAAICAAHAFGIEPKAISAVLRNFKGVAHRLEPAGKIAGITFINDSKATNVDSVTWALRSFDRPICLIAGGRHKGSSYAPIAKYGKDKIKGIVAIGEAKEIIFDDLGHQYPVQFAETLENAVETAFELAVPGDIVLLSPGCASFDMFENFEHRGEVFKKAVASLKNGKEKDETVVG